MYWDLKTWFGISKNGLGSQKMLWGLKKMVDIVDTVEAIWNNARLCNNQSQKR